MSNGSRAACVFRQLDVISNGLTVEGSIPLLYSPVGLDPKLAKRAPKDSLK